MHFLFNIQDLFHIATLLNHKQVIIGSPKAQTERLGRLHAVRNILINMEYDSDNPHPRCGYMSFHFCNPPT